MEQDFKDRNPAMQHLARELTVLRAHNLQFRPGDLQDTLLHFGEGVVGVVALEHFLRIIQPGARKKSTVSDLLRSAVKAKLVVLDDVDGTSKWVAKFRNALLHGDFAQRARQLGTTVRGYFGQHFAREIERMYLLTDGLMKQVDVRTGKPFFRLDPHQAASTPRSPTTRRRRRPAAKK